MTYQIVDTIITTIEPAVTAAEAHGMATGILCIDNGADAITWLNEIFQDTIDLLEEDKIVLLSLFEQTRKLINGDEFEFDLFIPDDTFSLREQTDGLSNWCKGFLLGVGYSTTEAKWPGETEEILKDIIEFSKVDIEIAEEHDEDENALMEIHEYLRAAVMLFRTEFGDTNDNDVVLH
jgi:uncharacterized protein YgfB (UPF0149 family)